MRLTAADISQALRATTSFPDWKHQRADGAGEPDGFDEPAFGADSRISSSSRQTPPCPLSDVANVCWAPDYESGSRVHGKKAVYVGIQVAPAANLLDVIKGVRDVFPSIRAASAGLSGEIIHDSTEFVNSAIKEVISSRYRRCDRDARILCVPGVGALGFNSDHRHSAVADRHLRRHVCARLPITADAAGARVGIGLWSMTPSSSSRTSIGILKMEWRRYQLHWARERRTRSSR